MRTRGLGIAIGLVCLALLPGLPAAAQALPKLFAAASAVPDQSDAARATAFTQDLAQVLVKVSGDRAAARYASTLDASELVSAYRYRRIPVQRGGGMELWARFDAQRVKSVLTAAGLPLWGANRPTVVVWLATPSGIISDTSSKPLTDAMRTAARARGLPLVLPLLDLADRQQVSTFDIRSFFLPTLKQASRRYDAQAMLIGSINPAAGGVNSTWHLVLEGDSNAFTIPAPSAQSAAAAAVNKTASMLANRFARLPGNIVQSALQLVISNVDSLGAAVAARRAITSVQGVKALQLSAVDGAKLQFSLSYGGTSEDFARLLELSGILTRNTGMTTAAAVGSTSQPTLRFRYTP